MLHDLATGLRARGHQVDVISSTTGYGGRRGAWTRLPAYLWYLGSVAVKLIFRAKPDLILAMTTPPFLGVLAKVAAWSHGCRHAHWVMDLYPDVLVAHGALKSRSFLYRMLRSLARWQFEGASAVIALGPRMAGRLSEYVNEATIGWVPLWGTEGGGAGSRFREERGWKNERLVLMYSGNMGRGHTFDDFLGMAGRLGTRGPLWVFAGDGARKHEVEEYAAGNPAARIRVIPSVPAGKTGQSLASADVLLVSLRAEWGGLMVPSKIQGIFASGRPVIFVGGVENEIADWIRRSGAGWVVKEGNLMGLGKAVREAGNPGERKRRGKAGRSFGRANFDRCANVREIVDLLLPT